MNCFGIACIALAMCCWRASAYVDGYVGDRYNRSSAYILQQLLLQFVDGPFPRKVAQYNTKQYFPRYNRFYWIGERYYPLDPDSFLADRSRCDYVIPGNHTLVYEDDEPVEKIVFQCRRFQEACCGEMDCCLIDEHGYVRPRFTDE